MKILIIVFIFLSFSGYAKTEVSKIIPQGRFAPLYGIEKNQKDLLIKSFRMDVFPVSMNNFNQFLQNNPNWKKENIVHVYADKNYLTQKKSAGNSPVVFVSWFAANAYCECNGARLPTIDEWEYVAMSDETLKDARKKVSYNQYILDWYENL